MLPRFLFIIYISSGVEQPTTDEHLASCLLPIVLSVVINSIKIQSQAQMSYSYRDPIIIILNLKKKIILCILYI